MESIYNFSYDQLVEMCLENGFKKYNANQIFSWLYRKRVTNYDEMTDISKKLRMFLKENYSIGTLEILQLQISEDSTRKYLFRLADGSSIEAVLMHYDYGNTICVTSQVGCNMGCTFCASGLLKKQRDLTSGEMVLQVLSVQKDIDESEKRISHIVVMGTGEPFDNYDNVMNFLSTVNHDLGLGIGARHITISTCGLVEQIKRFADEKTQYNLAISLHAPNDKIRSQIMPINKAYPIDKLMEALKYYTDKNNRRLSFEYILLKGVNDTENCVSQLAELTKHFDVYVNLIPYNHVDENGYVSTDYKSAMAFYDKLMKKNVRCTLRQKMGDDIDAACGQLRSKYERKNIHE
ncbi:MAG TPA: 23S rRNA (adenine(2503)-C(2))-methyltransferase RlmN [Erysipelotrichaceae bacterium]|jgi:23S rRNA (adenine2503-C2)-methyltransferase|nr:23S rRNA (adenine(2503)-C(2))-methyltransferase RlmN [Erysipelotrichaceae bacterium]HQA85368.1 23S rRNA (adenine(2503)-C(2))-methyltransferase RlmN [Erysipelotrichaceae bacterium]